MPEKMTDWEKLAQEFNPLEEKQFAVLDKDGNIVNKTHFPKDVSNEKLIEMYRLMAYARLGNAKMLALQRMGRMGTFASSEGQEAAQVGALMAIDKKTDWVFPAFREFPAGLYMDVPMLQLAQYWAGFESGARYDDNIHIMPPAIPVGSQTAHAVGYAYAMKLRHEPGVTVTFFGDGGSSEGDFHEAMNFAGVFATPTIFICQNNQWAISTPRKVQTASKTIAQKAIAYGFEGIQVDGNDLFAMYTATKYARAHALTKGPVLIEAYTYRLGDHTTADSAKIYRNDDEVKEWRTKDPMLRLRAYMESQKIWDAVKEEALNEEGKAFTTEIARKLKETSKQQPSQIFEHMYKDLTWSLKDQQKYLSQFFPDNK